MGLTLSVNKNNFEDMQKFINNNNITIINTLDLTQQQCLIKNTISADKETDYINTLIKTNLTKAIVIYGKNCNDENVITKYKQLKETDIYFTNENQEKAIEGYVLDELNIKDLCCRRHFLTHVDI